MLMEAGYTPPGGAGVMLPLAANSDATLMRSPVLVMETDVAPVTAGGAVPGWVSGSFASLAPAVGLNIVFDLGPNWAQYVFVSLVVFVSGPSSGISTVQVFGGSAPVLNFTRRLRDALSSGSGTIYSAWPASSGPQEVSVRPMGRYIVVAGTNADATNATGPSSKVVLAAYPS